MTQTQGQEWAGFTASFFGLPFAGGAIASRAEAAMRPVAFDQSQGNAFLRGMSTVFVRKLTKSTNWADF